jgi:ribonuclease P protein subunit RPR2
MQTAQAQKPVKEIVSERVSVLLSLAEKISDSNPERAKRYIAIMRALCKRHNYRLPKEMKLKFCKKCGAYWKAGKTARVRLNKRTKCAEYVCILCGAKRTLSYAKKA